MTTLNLEASKKVYELLGDTYETEYFRDRQGKQTRNKTGSSMRAEREDGSCIATADIVHYLQSPNFSELIRLLPKIGENKGWSEDIWDSNRINLRRMSHILAEIYMLAPTEGQGMEEVSNYLRKIL